MIGRNEEVPVGVDAVFAGLEVQTAESNRNRINILGHTYSSDLKTRVEESNRGVELELLMRYDNNESNLLRRSDEWPFLQKGIPSLFFHTGLILTITSESIDRKRSSTRSSSESAPARSPDELGSRIGRWAPSVRSAGAAPRRRRERRRFRSSDPDAAASVPPAVQVTPRRSRCEDCDRELLPRSEIEAAPSDRVEPLAVQVMRRTEGSRPRPTSRTALLGAQVGPRVRSLGSRRGSSFCPLRKRLSAGPLVCVDCQTELRPRSWVERARRLRSDPASTEVVLADVENPFRADVLRSALHDQGVWFTEQPTGWRALRFVVRPIDLELARELLADIDESAESGLVSDSPCFLHRPLFINSG